MRKMKALIADDQPIVIRGLQSFFDQCPDLGVEALASASCGQDLVALCASLSPELLIVELSLSGMDGLEAIRKIRRRHAALPVVVYSRFDDPKIVSSALKDGANAYLLKSSPLEEWYPALEAIRKGEAYADRHIPEANRHQADPTRIQDIPFGKLGAACLLTRRESEILRLIVQAMSNKEIGHRLYISDQTVSVHRKNIMRKLGVSNTAGLVKAAFEQSLV